MKPNDHWLQSKKPYHSLKVKGEGDSLKRKKRKLDINVEQATSFQNPQLEGPFGAFSSQLDII